MADGQHPLEGVNLWTPSGFLKALRYYRPLLLPLTLCVIATFLLTSRTLSIIELFTGHRRGSVWIMRAVVVDKGILTEPTAPWYRKIVPFQEAARHQITVKGEMDIGVEAQLEVDEASYQHIDIGDHLEVEYYSGTGFNPRLIWR